MTLIGMLHHRSDPNNVKRTYAYYAAARAEGVDFFYFSPGKVNLDNKSILGKIYEGGEWVDKQFPFPDVIFNASYPITDKGKDIVGYLSEKIPFTSHPIGDKLSVYQKIRRGKEFEQFLIPTIELKDYNMLVKMIDTHNKIVVKPLSGNQGGGIVFIEKDKNDCYQINEVGELSYYDKDKMLEYLSNKIQDQEYLVQKYISCKTKYGNVYDMRLHVQKNGEGKWVITSIYPRIGQPGRITSNMGSGGYTCYLDHFLKSEFEDTWYDIRKTLEYFAVSFSNHFDSLYDTKLDELGIDVGIDKDHKIWVFEVNWRPGTPIIFSGELDVVRNTIRYAKYLAEVKNKSE